MSKYDVEFKKSIIALYQNGKSQAELSREYGVSLSAKQVRELQKRNALLEEENLMLFI